MTDNPDGPTMRRFNGGAGGSFPVENPDSLVTEPIGCGRCDPYTAHLLGDAGLYGETCADIGCKERTWRLLPDQPTPENTASPVTRQ